MPITNEDKLKKKTYWNSSSNENTYLTQTRGDPKLDTTTGSSDSRWFHVEGKSWSPCVTGDWWDYTFNTPKIITLLELFGGVGGRDYYNEFDISIFE